MNTTSYELLHNICPPPLPAHPAPSRWAGGQMGRQAGGQAGAVVEVGAAIARETAIKSTHMII